METYYDVSEIFKSILRGLPGEINMTYWCDTETYTVSWSKGPKERG